MGRCKYIKQEFDNILNKAYDAIEISYEKSAKLTTKQRKKLKSSQFCQI
jgi:hypothetical protein